MYKIENLSFADTKFRKFIKSKDLRFCTYQILKMFKIKRFGHPHIANPKHFQNIMNFEFEHAKSLKISKSKDFGICTCKIFKTIEI